MTIIASRQLKFHCNSIGSMSLLFTILAGVAGLTGSALVASVTQTFTGTREPTHKMTIKILPASEADIVKTGAGRVR